MGKENEEKNYTYILSDYDSLRLTSLIFYHTQYSSIFFIIHYTVTPWLTNTV